jgi:hypothetical protein
VRTAVLIDPGGWDDSGLGRAPAPQPSNSATRVARQSAEANGRPRRTSTRLATVVIFYLLACLDPSDPGSVAGIAALVLLAPVVGVLVGAAGSKLRDQVGFRRTLDEQGWPSALVPATAVSVPLVEGGLVLLLIVPDTELFGAIAAAAVFGAFAALPAVGALVVLAAAIDEAGLIALPHPQRYAQVPRGLLHSLGLSRGAFVYGTILGFGLLTYISSSAFYAALLYSVMTLGPDVLLAPLAFGVGRAVPVAALSWSLTNADKIEPLAARLSNVRSASHRVQSLVLAMAAGLLLGALLP